MYLGQDYVNVHLDHVIQLLQNGGHDEATDAAEEEGKDEEQLHNAGGRHRLEIILMIQLF